MTDSPGKAIVIVDDEKSYVDLLAQMLAEQFVNPVHTFTRPLAALQGIEGMDVGLIVTDYYMPQISGIELIERVRAVRPGIPFIIITGHGIHLTEEDFKHIPELKSVLHKPFGWRALAAEILRAWPRNEAPVIRDPAVAR